jgi:prepilin-type N-terminal cleavage/methylation domain-containing protein
MTTSARVPSTRASGFSLLEVLVASAVLAIVMAVLLSTLTTSLSLWRTTESKIAADREGRSAELLLAQDISSAIMTTNPLLWPRVVDGSLLQFLTLKPSDYQNANAGDVGDVCLVEYSVDPETFSLVRRFWGSKETFDILKSGNALPPPGGSGVDPQMVATNVLPEMHDAVRGLKVYREPLRTAFVMLDQQLMPIKPPYAVDNVPAAVEINIGVADPDAMRNKDLLSNPDFILRNAGFYSFRLGFPKTLP